MLNTRFNHHFSLKSKNCYLSQRSRHPKSKSEDLLFTESSQTQIAKIQESETSRSQNKKYFYIYHAFIFEMLFVLLMVGLTIVQIFVLWALLENESILDRIVLFSAIGSDRKTLFQIESWIEDRNCDSNFLTSMRKNRLVADSLKKFRKSKDWVVIWWSEYLKL